MAKATTSSQDRSDPLCPGRQGGRGRLGRAHEIGAQFPARGSEAHGHEGRLRGRRLRRVHGGRRRARGRRGDDENRQRLHPVRAGARWQGTLHRGGPAAAERRSASGAAGNGRLPRLAMRLLHPRVRDVALGALRRARGRRDSAHRGAASKRAYRKSLPLHRVSPHPRCRQGRCSTCRERRSTASALRGQLAVDRAQGFARLRARRPPILRALLAAGIDGAPR